MSNREDQQQLDANSKYDRYGQCFVSSAAVGYSKINLGNTEEYIPVDRLLIEIEVIKSPLPADMVIHHRFNIMANDAPENLFLLTEAQNLAVQKTLGRILNSPSSFGEQTGRLYEVVQKLSTANVQQILATKELSVFFSPRQEKSDDSLIMFCNEPEERLL